MYLPECLLSISSVSAFMKLNGIEERANQLCKQNPAKAEEIKIQLNRLINDEHMGSLFKVLEVEI